MICLQLLGVILKLFGPFNHRTQGLPSTIASSKTTCHCLFRPMIPLFSYFTPFSLILPLLSPSFLKITHPQIGTTLIPIHKHYRHQQPRQNGTPRPTSRPPLLSQHSSRQPPSHGWGLRHRPQRNPLLLLPPLPLRPRAHCLLHWHLAARPRHCSKDNLRVRSTCLAGI